MSFFRTLHFLFFIGFMFLATSQATAGMGTRMRKAKAGAVVVTMAWSPNPSTWNFNLGAQSYTLTNTGSNPVTGLSFSTPIYAGQFSMIPNNQGDVQTGSYIYIYDHNCGTSLAAGASCTVSFNVQNSMGLGTISTTCSAISGSYSTVLTNLTYDDSM